MVVLKYRNFRLCVSPLIAIIELIIIFCAVKFLLQPDSPKFNAVDCVLVSCLILSGSLGSLFLHEYAHMLAARLMSLPMKGMTVSFFGAYSVFGDFPLTARTSFAIAVAGPLMNLFLASILYAVHLSIREPAVLGPVTFCLSVFNGILGVYNLIPVIPLDGGYIVRSVFWGKENDLLRSNRIAFHIGNIFISGCFLAGIAGVIRLDPFMGAICIILGMSLLRNAKQAYQQMISTRIFNTLSLKNSEKGGDMICHLAIEQGRRGWGL
jgi:Zn-dependent protease